MDGLYWSNAWARRYQWVEIFIITIQVFFSAPAYSALLARSWCHIKLAFVCFVSSLGEHASLSVYFKRLVLLLSINLGSPLYLFILEFYIIYLNGSSYLILSHLSLSQRILSCWSLSINSFDLLLSRAILAVLIMVVNISDSEPYSPEFNNRVLFQLKPFIGRFTLIVLDNKPKFLFGILI
jgi:hypothetical protein